MDGMTHKNTEIQISKNRLLLQATCTEQRHYNTKINETSATGTILCASFILQVSYLSIICHRLHYMKYKKIFRLPHVLELELLCYQGKI